MGTEADNGDARAAAKQHREGMAALQTSATEARRAARAVTAEGNTTENCGDLNAKLEQFRANAKVVTPLQISGGAATNEKIIGSMSRSLDEATAEAVGSCKSPVAAKSAEAPASAASRPVVSDDGVEGGQRHQNPVSAARHAARDVDRNGATQETCSGLAASFAAAVRHIDDSTARVGAESRLGARLNEQRAGLVASTQAAMQSCTTSGFAPVK